MSDIKAADAPASTGKVGVYLALLQLFFTLGWTIYLWPRVTGREWWSTRLLGWHFWLTGLGMLIMFIDLTAGGLVQGFLWRGLAPWEESLAYSMPFWWVRIFTGLMIIAGQLLFVWNMIATARSGAPTRERPVELEAERIAAAPAAA